MIIQIDQHFLLAKLIYFDIRALNNQRADVQINVLHILFYKSTKCWGSLLLIYLSVYFITHFNLISFAWFTQLYFIQIMKKRNLTQPQSPSRVLLVCVYDTVVLNITNETAYSRFSPFGTIIKILIFERGQVTKFFLEFADIISAQNAKISLDGAKLFQTICKMNIYYSNFRSVDLKHETSQGVSLQSSILASYPYLYHTTAYPNYHAQTHTPANTATFQPFAPLSNYASLYDQFYSSERVNLDLQPIRSPQKQGESEIQCKIQHEIDWLLRSDQKKQNFSDNNLTQSAFGRNQIYCYICFEIRQRKMSNRQIYNLFSNFGNISFIKKTSTIVYIKFRSNQFSAMAKNYLYGYIFMNSTLNLDYVSQINIAQPHENEYAQVTYFDPSFDRFTNTKSISINPPSKTLHVSSIRRQTCREDLLFEVFEQFGVVEGVEVLSNGSEKNMALVQFANIEDSFYAISQMHNSLLNGRKIQISFTKSKLS